jgi:DNA-binding response OmpR family regulator
VARVLVVEDDTRLAELVAAALRADGHLVSLAYDGKTALREALIGAFDVIVLDVMLPQLDGFAVCRQLREADGQPAILLLTARDTVVDRVHGLDVGADD